MIPMVYRVTTYLPLSPERLEEIRLQLQAQGGLLAGTVVEVHNTTHPDYPLDGVGLAWENAIEFHAALAQDLEGIAFLVDGRTYRVVAGDIPDLVDMLEEWLIAQQPEPPEPEEAPVADTSLPDRIWVQPFNWSAGGHTIGAMRNAAIDPRASTAFREKWGEYTRADLDVVDYGPKGMLSTCGQCGTSMTLKSSAERHPCDDGCSRKAAGG